MEAKNPIKIESEQNTIQLNISKINELIIDGKKYNLLINYNYENIIFTVIENDDNIEKLYTASYDLLKIVNILELNPNKYDNFEKVYDFIVKSINKKGISIKIENDKFFITIRYFICDELIESKIELSETIRNDIQIISLLVNNVRINEEKIKKLENIVQKQDIRIKKEENNTAYKQKYNNLKNEINKIKEVINNDKKYENLEKNINLLINH